MLRVRHAVPGDLSAFLEIAHDAATGAQWDQRLYQRILAREMPERVALLMEEDGHPLGFLVAREAVGEWELENIAVRSQERGRGLGSRLLGEFMDLARRRNGRAVFLEVRESNLAARALYQQWAFAETGRRKSYYQNPPEDALVFRFIFSPEA